MDINSSKHTCLSARSHLVFVFLLGPSRQHSCWREDQSADCVGLLGEDSSNWHKSTFQQVSKS